MKFDLRNLKTTVSQNEAKYRKRTGQLHTLKEQYIAVINDIFNKKEKDYQEELYTCNSKIKSRVARLNTKICSLEDRVKTHEDAQAVYSNHDVIEMHKELQDLVAQYDQTEFDREPHALKTMNHLNVRMEDSTPIIERLIFNQEGKVICS